MAPRVIAYDVEGWGVSELVLDGDRVLWHELPTPRRDAHVTDRHPELVQRIRRYFAGEVVSFDDVELELGEHTPFHRRCVEALRAIPRGEVVTYGELAALAGAARAARAAGTFCAHNRFGILVPCHRVVGVDGLGSYGSLGLEYKRRLLRLEDVPV